METLNQLYDSWYPTLEPYLSLLTPQQWAMAGGGLLALWVLWRLLRRIGRRKRKPKAADALRPNPNLQVQHVQIAPLGRDAFFKIRNDGDTLILSTLIIPDRPDIVVKKPVSGQRLERGQAFAILLETSSAQRITPGMPIHLTYVDLGGQVHTCSFAMA